jgi:hypothetical protein
MPGGLLNLVSYGAQNVILNGNPSKTFFKCTYAKYTNFGLQKFRIDFDGQRTLRMTEPSTFSFKVPRYGDLLMDTYLVVTLPTIWSTILPLIKPATGNECLNCYCTENDNPSLQYSPDCNTPCNNGQQLGQCSICAETGELCGIRENSLDIETMWCPYEFKWIKNLGTQMIKSVRFIVGGQVIQEYTGDQLYNMVERDFDDVKKDLYYKMTGNVVELHDPANAFGRNNEYPNVWPDTTREYKTLGPEPSIRARKLYIPLNSWFTLAAKMAFPLVSLQYAEMSIEVEMRPVNELFVVRDIEHAQLVKYDAQGKSVYGPQPHIQPNFNNQLYQFYRFLQPVPTRNNFLDISGLRSADFYDDRRTSWAADVHLISTYAFLTDDEVRVFAEKPQKYLIKEAYQYTYNNVVGSGKVELDSMGMVSNWMWFFRRTDAHLRNEWSNYSNWPYHTLPHNVKGVEAYQGMAYQGMIDTNLSNEFTFLAVPQGLSSGTAKFEMSDYKLSGTFNPENQKDIMLSWAVIMDGKYRENTLDAGVLNYVEKYVRTSGNGQDGLYCYNFGLFSTPDDFQPSGAMNMSKFSKVEFEFSTFSPPLDPNAQTSTICDGDGNIIGINKPVWRIYDYTYDLVVMEERYNILTFESGNAGLMYAR